jgi:hypothetical protein
VVDYFLPKFRALILHGYASFAKHFIVVLGVSEGGEEQTVSVERSKISSFGFYGPYGTVLRFLAFWEPQ